MSKNSPDDPWRDFPLADTSVTGSRPASPDDPLAMFAGDEQPGEAVAPRPSAAKRARRWAAKRWPFARPRSPGWPPPPSARKHAIWLALVGVAVAACVLAGIVLVLPRLRQSPAASQTGVPAEGRLSVESRPDGAQVEVDGTARGTTPLTLRLAAGRHSLRVGGTRELEVSVPAGAEVVHHLELPVSVARLHIETVPRGVVVSLDGRRQGAAPLDLENLAVGRHVISVGSGGSALRREVDLRPGTDNSVVLTLAAPGPSTGWVALSSPIDVEIYEGTRLVGRSQDGQVLLLAGTHDLRLVNRQLNFEDSRPVNITPGNTTTVTVRPGSGLLNVNAVPWAEVWLDGKRIGETPIANLSTSIGTHELLLRHPSLGEQKRTVVVGVGTPARVGVNFRQ